MRIDAIRNGRIDQFTSNRSHNTNRLNSLTAVSKSPAYDSVCFKGGYLLKGAGLGTLAGLASAAVFSAVTGGLGLPAILAINVAAGSVAGGCFGKATDDLEKEKTN